MKNLLASILILVLSTISFHYCLAQSIPYSFKEYDIKNSSCEVFDAVSSELQQPKYGDDIKKLVEERAKYSLQSRNDVEGFILDFNSALNRTKKQYEAQEFLWKSGKEIGKYGLNVLGNYAQELPTKTLTNFLTPAIQQGYELYIDSEINSRIEDHKIIIDKLIKDRIDLLYSNGIDVTKSTDQAAFDALFSAAHADIPALSSAQYGAFTKELNKRAYDFIAKNRQDIHLLDLKLSNQYERVKSGFNSNIDTMKKNITDEVNIKLADLSNSIGALEKNQQEVFRTLDEIQSRVLSNEKRISQLESEMASAKNDIANLTLKQEEHSRLIAQNAFQVDILSGYTFQSLNTEQKLNALKNGHFDNIFNLAEKQKLTDDLIKVQEKETIISVSKTVEAYSQGAYSALTSIGVLKGKDAQNVGKFIYALSIASGVARVYAGDFSGFASIISGIGGLKSKPQKSPELQMMEQMYDVMNQRFDGIDVRLKIIDTKLDSLASLVINIYKNLALSFQYQGNQIERLSWKIDNLNVKSTAILYKDYQACKKLSDIWYSRKTPFVTYSDYIQNYNNTCQKCLEGLNDFTIGKNQSYFYVSSNEELKDENVIQVEVNEIYKPTKELFKLFHNTNMNAASNALMFPVRYTKHTNKPLYDMSKLPELGPLDYSKVLENYFSYEMINEFSSLLLQFGNYFIISGNNNDFKPLKFREYLISTSPNGVNQDLFESRLLKTLSITQYAVAQQSLLAGNLLLDPIYSTLFGYSSNQDEINLSIKVLKNNWLLSTNFSTYLINTNVKLTDTLRMKRLIESATVDNHNVDTLNTMISLNNFKFHVNATDKTLHINFTSNGQNIDLPCADFDTILNDTMLNNEAVYSLLATRQNINSKLIDLTFTKNIEDLNSKPIKFKYLYTGSSIQKNLLR